MVFPFPGSTVTTPKILKIKKKVVDLITATACKIDPESGVRHRATIFLLGQNHVGTIVDCERLAEIPGGCKWVPAASASEVSRAYMELARRGTRPGIFAHFFPDDIHDKTNAIITNVWYHAFGEDPIRNPGRIWIRFLHGECIAIKPEGSRYDGLTQIPIKIIE